MEIVALKTEDGVRLNGIMYNGNNSKRLVISVHGMATNCIKKREEIIGRTLNSIDVDYLTFNNRGHDVICYMKKVLNGKAEKFFGGTAYENFDDCYYDIKSAINYGISNGYKDIFLLGHSLGSTKVVYTYNRLKNNNEEIKNKIKGVLLLSLIDIQSTQKIYLGEKYKSLLEYAKNLEQENKGEQLMPDKSFIYPMSVRVYLKFFKEDSYINFAQYSNNSYEFKELNNIDVPLFMRWGDTNELILQEADKLCSIVKGKIKNTKMDINYIDGADHSYNGKEQVLAEEIKNFIQKI